MVVQLVRQSFLYCIVGYVNRVVKTVCSRHILNSVEENSPVEGMGTPSSQHKIPQVQGAIPKIQRRRRIPVMTCSDAKYSLCVFRLGGIAGCLVLRSEVSYFYCWS